MENSFDIEAFLRKAVAVGASDIHLQSGEHPAIRVDGKIVKVDMPVLADDELTEVYKKLLPVSMADKFHNAYDLDFAYEVKGCSRFRVNLSRQLGKCALVIRTIPYNIKKIATNTSLIANPHFLFL